MKVSLEHSGRVSEEDPWEGVPGNVRGILGVGSWGGGGDISEIFDSLLTSQSGRSKGHRFAKTP